MRCWRQAVLLGAALVALGAPVCSAAETFRPAAVNWTGLYIGGHIGATWAEANSTVVTNAGMAFPPGTRLSSHPINGPLAGVHAGVNWQWQNLVLGVEGEFSASSARGTAISVSPIFPGVRAVSEGYHTSFLTATGRLGYAWGNTLLYVKGGAVWVEGGVDSETRNAAGVLLATATGDGVRQGWTFGGGFEHHLVAGWSARFEGQYLDFGVARVGRQQTLTAVGQPNSALRDIDLQAFQVKAGFNYRFGLWPRGN